MKQKNQRIKLILSILMVCFSHALFAQCAVTIAEAGGVMTATSAGTAPFAYAWSNGAATMSTTITVPTTYCCTVTDANGCSSIGCYTATSGVCSTTLLLTGSDELTVTATGVAPFSYLWSNGAVSNSLTGIVSGVYCVTSTDNTGCVSSDCTTVTVSPCGMAISEANDSLFASGTGSAPFSYLWSNGVTTNYNAVLVNGSYCVTVTDGSGCTAWGCYNYTSSGCSSIITQTSADELTVAATGIVPFAYQWSNGSNSNSISGLVSGVYCVTATDAVGCASITCFAITVAGCSVVVTESAGTLTAGSTGASPFIYLWNDGSTSGSLISSIAGVYCCTVTDANGCAGTGCYVVTTGVCSAVLVETAPGALSVTASGVAPFVYQWDMGSNTPTVTGLIDGTYCVTITDNTGCQATACATIILPPVCNVVMSMTTDTIAASSTGTAPFTYFWDNGTSADMITGLVSGTVYCVTVTDANGCIANACVTYLYINPCEANFLVYFNNLNPDTLHILENSTASTGASILQWTWDFGDGIMSTDQYPTHFYSQYGLYFLCLTVLDDAGCTSSYCDSIGVDSNGTYLGKTGGFTISMVSDLPELTSVIQEQSAEFDMQLYPNPVMDLLNVKFQQVNASRATLSIMDVNGKLVYEQVIKVSNARFDTSVNVADLKPGMYIVNVKSDEVFSHQRFVKLY